MVPRLKSSVQKTLHVQGKTLKRLTSLVPYVSFTPRLSGPIVTSTEKISTESILQHLVSVPSVSGDREHCRQLIDYIDRFLSERALYVKRFEFNGVESIVATTKNTKHPRVMLLGHIDTVPAETAMFQLRKSEHNYIGRGVLDMKGPVASMLMAIDALTDNIHAYDFGIMITSDEETSGYNGTRQLVEQKGYLADVVVCPDGATNWALQDFAKGVWHIEIEARGKAAHGSRPWEGESATERLMDVLRDIRSLFDHSKKTNSTINIGTLQGGQASNQIPDSASAGIDIRFASHEDVDRLKTAVSTICEKHQVTFISKVFSPPCVNDPDNQYLAAFLDTVTEVIGKNPGTTLSYALDDARFFNAKGVPCAVFSPAGGGHHGPEEWIPIEALEQLQRVLVSYLQKQSSK